MGVSLIGGSCLEVGVLDPSILKTERPACYRTLLTASLHRRHWLRPRAQRPPARAGSFSDPKPTSQRSPAHVSNFKISFSQGQSDQAFRRQGTMIGRHPARLPDVPWFGANVGIKKTSLALERRHDGLSLVLYPNDQNLRYCGALIAHRMSDIGADVFTSPAFRDDFVPFCSSNTKVPSRL